MKKRGDLQTETVKICSKALLRITSTVGAANYPSMLDFTYNLGTFHTLSTYQIFEAFPTRGFYIYHYLGTSKGVYSGGKVFHVAERPFKKAAIMLWAYWKLHTA